MAIDSTRLNIHAFLPLTYGNGPGARACLWVQGCSINCPGCFNPETHSQSTNFIDVSEAASWIEALDNVQGLTISGGEPLQQIAAVTDLCTQIRMRTKLSIIVFTGYFYEEAVRMPGFELLTRQIDVLIAGPYQYSGSKQNAFGTAEHKTIHFFSERYKQVDLDVVPLSEVIIGLNGEVMMTGVDPIRLRH